MQRTKRKANPRHRPRYAHLRRLLRHPVRRDLAAGLLSPSSRSCGTVAGTSCPSHPLLWGVVRPAPRPAPGAMGQPAQPHRRLRASQRGRRVDRRRLPAFIALVGFPIWSFFGDQGTGLFAITTSFLKCNFEAVPAVTFSTDHRKDLLSSAVLLFIFYAIVVYVSGLLGFPILATIMKTLGFTPILMWYVYGMAVTCGPICCPPACLTASSTMSTTSYQKRSPSRQSSRSAPAGPAARSRI